MNNQKPIRIVLEDSEEICVNLSDFNSSLNLEADGIGHEAAPEGSLGHEAAPEGSLGHEAPGGEAEYEYNLKNKLIIDDKLEDPIDYLLEFKKEIYSK